MAKECRLSLRESCGFRGAKGNKVEGYCFPDPKGGATADGKANGPRVSSNGEDQFDPVEGEGRQLRCPPPTRP